MFSEVYFKYAAGVFQGRRRGMLDGFSPEPGDRRQELRVEVRKALRRCFNKKIARRPLILPVILEL